MECGKCLQPRNVLLAITLTMTAAATALLCAAIMTDHWEEVAWQKEKLVELFSTNFSDFEMSMTWHVDDKVSRVVLKNKKSQEVVRLFLVPVNGGIWTLCLALNDQEKLILEKIGFPRTQCLNYLTPESEMEWRDDRTDWQHRMQNLSISCSFVCLIMLGASALVGAFGLIKNQISAVLVTGVMYLLAGTFALFTLSIIYYKRKSAIAPMECMSGGGDGAFGFGPKKLTTKLIAHYISGRNYVAGWSFDLGLSALALCAAAASLWILLARVMRFTPLQTLIT